MFPDADALSQTGSMVQIDQELDHLAKLIILDLQIKPNKTKHIVYCLP